MFHCWFAFVCKHRQSLILAFGQMRVVDQVSGVVRKQQLSAGLPANRQFCCPGLARLVYVVSALIGVHSEQVQS